MITKKDYNLEKVIDKSAWIQIDFIRFHDCWQVNDYLKTCQRPL